MNKDKLTKILREHKQYLDGLPGGNRANLQGADLRNANLRFVDLRFVDLQSAELRGVELQGVDLRYADLQCADLRNANLQSVDLQSAELQCADLRNANLRSADLQGVSLQCADLRGADLDYSCWPLWCGSLDVKVDARIARQLAYHFCRLDCDDPEYKAAREAMKGFANNFHRAEQCGKITGEKDVGE